uniref:Uncharacterized protein n=1 Tax=Anguilla anguilla TaxID=7936 RepID=A0A0E9PTE2_ANGAN
MVTHPAIHPLSILLFLVRVTGSAGAYPSVHWTRGRNTPWTGR